MGGGDGAGRGLNLQWPPHFDHSGFGPFIRNAIWCFKTSDFAQQSPKARGLSIIGTRHFLINKMSQRFIAFFLLFIAFFFGIASARIRRGSYGYNPSPTPPPQPCGGQYNQYGSGGSGGGSGGGGNVFGGSGGGGYNQPNCNTYGQNNYGQQSNYGQNGGGGSGGMGGGGPSQFGAGAPGCGGGSYPSSFLRRNAKYLLPFPFPFNPPADPKMSAPSLRLLMLFLSIALLFIFTPTNSAAQPEGFRWKRGYNGGGGGGYNQGGGGYNQGGGGYNQGGGGGGYNQGGGGWNNGGGGGGNGGGGGGNGWNGGNGWQN
uniref:Glycine-rich protein n=1 Tax=Globodera rostochiensis TaxID=31243 RepID=A0A914H2S6_GLORO